MSIVSTTDLLSGKTSQCWECAHYASNQLKRKDYTGHKFGKLTVLEMIYPSRTEKKKRTYAKCQCECGNIVVKQIDVLKRSEKNHIEISCGCYKQYKGENVIGQKFGKLLALKYIDNDFNKVECMCDCGIITVVSRQSLLSGHTKSCGCLQRETAKLIKTIDYSSYEAPNNISFISPHKQNKKGQWLWLCKCGICGDVFLELPARILNGHTKSCGKHKHSIRELFIEKILQENNIQYTREYTIDSCKHINKLHFDFAIFKENNLHALIEYDGEQHYRVVEHFGGEKGFINTQQRDISKNKYCNDNNLRLVRLPYYLSDEEIKEKILCVI